MRKILLTQDKSTLVDDKDYERVNKFKWFVQTSPSGKQQARNRRIGLLSRFILNPPVNKVVDHINGDSLDNRRKNLRVCSIKENGRNVRKKASTYKYKGVYKNQRSNGFFASITVDYKTKYIGFFPTKEEAAKAYNKKAEELFGEYASLNVLK